MKIDKAIALVTGGASGIGKACVQELNKQGATVVVWDKNIDCKIKENNAFTLSCDVSSYHEVEHALQLTMERVGVPRISIHCAGIAPAKRMVGKEGPMPFIDFKHVIDVNLMGTFNVMSLVSNAMSKLEIDSHSQERGVIINTASIAAFEGQIGQVAYSASKGGVVAMTLPAARELAAHAIRVNTIAPGLIATPLLLNLPQEIQESLAQSVTFPKRLGLPEEFAALAIHLIENCLINGEVIRLDGALRMQAR